MTYVRSLPLHLARVRAVAFLSIGGRGFDVTFHGVRGSTPCQGDEVARYGGNTSCVEVSLPDHGPILFDIGTGARYFGASWPPDQLFDGTCFLSHFHWDHIQGLPFFPPLLRPGSRLAIHAPEPDGVESLDHVMTTTLRPPLFPVSIEDFPGEVHFHAIGDTTVRLGGATVTARHVPHLGNTCGYRLEYAGASVAYMSDIQQPAIDDYTATDSMLELAREVDLLIHDAQYTRADFACKADWGHCTVEYAVSVAQQAGARALALFHHDPTHDDDTIDRLVAESRASAGPGLDVIGAREGLTVHLGA